MEGRRPRARAALFPALSRKPADSRRPQRCRRVGRDHGGSEGQARRPRQGYSYGEAADGAGPTFVRATSEEECLSRLLAGAADYILMDDLVVQDIVDHHTNEARSKLQFGSTPLVTRPLYFAVRRSRPDAQSIVDGFNTQIAELSPTTPTTDCCTSTGSRRTSTATASSSTCPRATTRPRRRTRLLALHGADAGAVVALEHVAAEVLHRWQYLSRLGDGARSRQADGRQLDAQPCAVDWNGVPIRVVSKAAWAWVLLVAGAVAGAWTGPQSARVASLERRGPIDIDAVPVPLNPRDSSATTVGDFRYAGGLALGSSQTELMHELSDIVITGDNHFAAVGDEGILPRGPAAAGRRWAAGGRGRRHARPR